MPKVIKLVAAAAITAAIIYFSSGTATAAAIAFFGTVALTALGGLLAKNNTSSGDFNAESRARQQMVRSAIEPRRVVYGQVRISGPLVFAETTPSIGAKGYTEKHTVPLAAPFTVNVANYTAFISDSGVSVVTQSAPGPFGRINLINTPLTKVGGAPAAGQYSVAAGVYTFNAAEKGKNVSITYIASVVLAANEYLHLVVPLAAHEVEEIGDVFFNDELGNTLAGGTQGRFSGYADVHRHLGDANQASDANLMAATTDWTAAHRLRGVAYIYVRLRASNDIWPFGIPNIKAVVKGKKPFDPRSSTTVWSDNWALCVRDYLISSYGLQCNSSELDDALVIAAANISDESIALPVEIGGTQKRYTCNGTVNLSDKPLDIMQQLLTAGAGSCVFTQGLYKIYAGAFTASVLQLNENDLRGNISVRARTPRKDLYNGVKGTYSNPANDWQPSDFPVIKNLAYATQDGAEILRDIVLPYTNDTFAAQRIAKIHLEKSRQGIVFTAPCKMTAFKLGVWDTVQWTIAEMGWSNKEFIIIGWSLANGGGIDLTLQEEASASYNWSSGNATVIDSVPDTNLANPFLVPAPGTPSIVESLYETTGSVGVRSQATLTWSPTIWAFQVKYQVQYKLADDVLWTSAGETELGVTSLDIFDLAPSPFNFRVRALSDIGITSLWAVADKQLVGLTAPPADITGFSIIKSSGVALAQWVQQPDLDVKIGGRIIIRHSPLTSGATWNDGIILDDFNGDAVMGALPLITGTYMAKAKDSSGNYSVNAASFVATEGMVTGFTTVANSTQDPAFTGTKSNVANTGTAIQLDGTTLIDSMATNIDDWPFIDSLGGIQATGSYAFNTYLDMTTAATRRFEADIKANSFDSGDLIDLRTNLIDTWAPFDGAVIDDCDVTLFTALTDDDPAGSPTWGPWTPFFVSDFTSRAARFKLDFASGNPVHNISVSTLRVDVKIPV